MSLAQQLDGALQRVAKWRSILAGWHLGTATKTMPGVQAMRNLREIVMILRMEQSALVAVLVGKGLMTVEDFQKALLREAELTEKDMAERFPGMRASDGGMIFHDPVLAADTMKRLGFPP